MTAKIPNNLDELFRSVEDIAKDFKDKDFPENVTIVLDVDAPTPRVWSATFKNNGVEWRDGGGDAADGDKDARRVKVSLKEDTLMGIATGKKSPTWAFMTGKVKIDGDSDLLKLLTKILPKF
ncbi:MAG: SCP2 sterol-binding domain-containing protein [Deltaproteobacteria bacterium]|jgi:hypothetical protein|nr:SCP2 sterol-binding domain-containing protein [Deltaproteobacteria bacterium]